MCDNTHGAGEAGARAAERGAALILLVARDPGSGAIRAQARALRRRAEEWAAEDVAALRAARAELAGREDDVRLAGALERARLAPLAIAELGADVAALAAAVHEHAHPDVEPEAVAAAALGAAAARIGAHLVAVNLATLERSPQLQRARDAEVVSEEVFARTYEPLGDLRDDAAIKPWIAQTTRRLAIDRLRAARREQPGDVEAAEEPEDARAAVGRLDDALVVRQALAQLAPDCQEVLDRFFARD